MSKLPETYEGKKVINGDKCKWFFEETIDAINFILEEMGYKYSLCSMSEGDIDSLIDFLESECPLKDSLRIKEYIADLKDFMWSKYKAIGKLKKSEHLVYDGENKILYEVEPQECNKPKIGSFADFLTELAKKAS